MERHRHSEDHLKGGRKEVLGSFHVLLQVQPQFVLPLPQEATSVDFVPGFHWVHLPQ